MYLRDGRENYLKDHYAAVAWTVVLEVLVAFVLVIVVDQASAAKLLSKIYAKIYSRLPEAVQKALNTDIRKHGLWFELFKAIPEEKEALLSIRLSDGSRMSGYFHSCTAYDSFKNTEIAIKKGENSSMKMLDRQDAIGQEEPYRQKAQELADDVIWVRGEEISYIKLRYSDKVQVTAQDNQAEPAKPAAIGVEAAAGNNPEVSAGAVLNAGAVDNQDRHRPRG